MLCRVHGIRTQRYIPPPPSKGEEQSERGCYPFGRGNAELTAEYWQLTAQAIERRISRGISYTSLSLIALMIASDLEFTASLL